MADPNAEFTGSIPAAYDRFLGPMLFEPYAADLVSRLDPSRLTAVLEIAAGTGILTDTFAASCRRLPRSPPRI